MNILYIIINCVQSDAFVELSRPAFIILPSNTKVKIFYCVASFYEIVA